MTKATANEYTSAKRVATALGHAEPDRIPFDLGSTKMTGIAVKAYEKLMDHKGWHDRDPDPGIFDPIQQLARVSDGVLRGLGADTRGIFPSPPSGWRNAYIPGGDFITLYDEWGVKWKKPVRSGYYFDVASSPLAGDWRTEDLNKRPWPDPLDDERVAALTEHIRLAQAQGEYALVTHGICAGILEMAFRLRGYEQLLMDFALYPAMVCALLDRILEIKAAYWEKALALAAGRIIVAIEADDLGTQNSLLISPRMYREFVKPRHRKLFARIKRAAPGIRVFLHSCGAVRPLIPDFIETGVDILNPVQSSAVGMDPSALKKDFGSELAFWGGGVDTQRVLPFGSPREVREDVRRRIDSLAPGGGFVFATVHNIQADVPPENIEAMLETLELYGKY